MFRYKMFLDTVGHAYGIILAQVCSGDVDNGLYPRGFLNQWFEGNQYSSKSKKIRYSSKQ